MTIVNRRQQRVVLERSGIDQFWRTLQEHYAGTRASRWRRLAMLSLRVNSGWTLEQLGLLFHRDKSEIARALAAVRKQLRARFQVNLRAPASRERERPESRPAIDSPRSLPLGEGRQRGSRDQSNRLDRKLDARRPPKNKTSPARRDSGR